MNTIEALEAEAEELHEELRGLNRLNKWLLRSKRNWTRKTHRERATSRCLQTELEYVKADVSRLRAALLGLYVLAGEPECVEPKGWGDCGSCETCLTRTVLAETAERK